MGIDETPSIPTSSPNAIASIAPSAPPADTPSVNGVASGLRSMACSTTPAAASAAPTIAPDSTRGRRATKKICASTFCSQGMERSNAFASEMFVLPTVGAHSTTADGADGKRRADGHDAAADLSRRSDAEADVHRATRLTGTTVMWPVSLWTCTSASTS